MWKLMWCKTNTNRGCTRRFDWLVKPMPISWLFLIGKVISHRVIEPMKNRGNRMITLEIHLKTAVISDQPECFDCYLSCTCFLKTAFPLPYLRKLRLCVVFKQALVETIQLAHAGSLYFYYEFDHNYLLLYDQFKVSLSTDDTTKKYFFYAGLAQSQQLKPLIFISKLSYHKKFKILTMSGTRQQFIL